MNFSPLLKTVQAMIDNRFAAFETCVPGIIRKVNGRTVDVEPSIRSCSSSGIVAKFDNFRFLDVPLLRTGNNVVTVNVEPKEGDRVLLLFVSRNIKKWKADGWKDAPSNPGGISRNDGGNCVALQISWDSAPNFVKVDKDGNLTLETKGKMDVTTNGDINITPVNGNLYLKADVHISGDLIAEGKVTAAGEVTANSNTAPVKLSTHTHVCAAPGSPTSPPTPWT